MRNPLACISCRSAKQKCIHNDAPPCDRCKANGRAEQCEFPQPGTSAIHRRPKRPRPSEDVSTASPQQAASFETATPTHHDDAHVTSGIGGGSEAAGTPPSASSVLFRLDPFDLITDEVKNSYLRCAYKWSFHHTPTLLLRIRDRTLEQWLAWAMLALAIRFAQSPPAPFRSQTEASNAYAAHARQLLQADLETPSISRVQALLMLTGHDWGAGNGRRAWIYLGMAIRLVEVMDLTQELKVPRNRVPTREEFIEAEVRRRTAWTCFLMDSLLSGGKGRKRSMNAADMAIQLPCERENFIFGEPVCTEHLDGKVRMPPVALPKGDIGTIGYSLRVANIWGKVARWACSDVIKTELPWSPSSQFQQLIYELDGWKNSLPQRSQYHLFSLHSHNAVEQGQAYCYMHSIYFMSYMFLHRAYLPVLGPHQNGNGAEDTPNSYNEHKENWKSWRKTSRRELFKESTTVLEMLEEMRTFGFYFLRGLVPWIGFTIYTAVGVMLYLVNFPSGEDDPQISAKARERVIQGCTFLKEMKTQWPMAETWFETIKRMQAYYRSSLGQDGPASPEERTALRRAMTDYGALQPTPVQKHTDSVRGPDTSIVQTTISPIQGHRPLSTPQLHMKPLSQHQPENTPPQYNVLSPATSVPTSNVYTPTFSWATVNAISIPEMNETFDFPGFDMSSAEMDEIMMTATQDFWASFPGEVGAGYGNDNTIT